MRTMEIKMLVTEDEATALSAVLMVGSDDGEESCTEFCPDLSHAIDQALNDPQRTTVDFMSEAVTLVAKTEAEPPTSSTHMAHAYEAGQPLGDWLRNVPAHQRRRSSTQANRGD